MSMQTRQKMERKIVGQLVDDILKASYRVGVSLERGYDIDEMLMGSTNKAKIMAEAFAGDECHLFVQPTEGPLVQDEQVISKGWFYLVFGNDGYDVISDYTVNFEKLAKGANKLADKLEEAFYKTQEGA